MSVKLFGGNTYQPIKWWTFPGGERGVRIESSSQIAWLEKFTIECLFKSSDDLIDVLLLADAIREIYGNARIRLKIPYFPYARQDRVMVEGEPLSLRVAVQLINLGNFTEIEIWDPHSTVLPGMFPAGKLLIKTQEELMSEYFRVQDRGDNAVLVSPDAGALKKIYKLAERTGMPVVEANKVRDPTTGKIIGVSIPPGTLNVHNNIWVVDDICDGGATFITLAQGIFKYINIPKLHLLVTHGIFSKGMEELNKYYSTVHAINDMRDA